MSKPYRPPYKYFEVVWEDATTHTDSWVHKDEEINTELVTTRGWLVNEKEGYVSLAASVSADGEGEDIVGNVSTIPRGMIKSMREVRVVSMRKKKDVVQNP